MTSANDDIVLKKIDDPEEKKLPVGIYVISFDNRFVFARRFGGRFIPVSAQEQEQIIELLS